MPSPASPTSCSDQLCLLPPEPFTFSSQSSSPETPIGASPWASLIIPGGERTTKGFQLPWIFGFARVSSCRSPAPEVWAYLLVACGSLNTHGGAGGLEAIWLVPCYGSILDVCDKLS